MLADMPTSEIEKLVCGNRVNINNRNRGDYLHMLVEIPPKMSVSSFVGFLKGGSGLIIHKILWELEV